MKSPLNSSLEVGLRILMLLSRAFPSCLDINRLVLLDHGLLHSSDLGGPESLHPAIPIRAGELGMKRRVIEQGLEVMIRAGLVSIEIDESGIQFRATDEGPSFVDILSSDYAITLRSRAAWVIEHFQDLTESSLREQMREIFEGWAEEFDPISDATGIGGRS